MLRRAMPFNRLQDIFALDSGNVKDLNLSDKN